MSYAGKATDQAAEAMRVSGSSVRDAAQVAKKAPVKLAEIKAGKKTLTQATREIKEAVREEDQAKIDANRDCGFTNRN